MSTIIQDIERAQLRELPRFKAGDTVRVHFKVIEGTRQRIQVFEGICIKRQGAGVRETFTVRKTSFGVGVERTFPLHSPKIDKIEVGAIGDVNRAKLYYLRGKIGKKARVRELRQSCTAVARRRAALSSPRWLGPPALGCSPSIVVSARASSRAPTRPAAGRSPGRSSSPVSCSTSTELRGPRARPLAYLNDSKQVDPASAGASSTAPSRVCEAWSRCTCSRPR